MIYWTKKPDEVVPGTLGFATAIPSTETVDTATATAVDSSGTDVSATLLGTVSIDEAGQNVTLIFNAISAGIYVITVEVVTDPGDYVVAEQITLTVALTGVQEFTCDFSTAIGKVRFEIGDTRADKHLLTDAEIVYALSVENNYIGAAARLAEALAARFASDDGVRVVTNQWNHANISKRFMELAKRLRARGITAGQFIMPSKSINDKTEQETNLDNVQPFFKRDMMPNPDSDESDATHDTL